MTSAEVLKKQEVENSLPNDWQWVKLGDICEITMGQSPIGSSYNSEEIGEPLLNGPTEFGELHPSPIQWTTNPVRYAEPGDILFCVRGATTGRKNIADRRYCIGRGLAAIRGKSGQAINEYLFFALDIAISTLLGRAAGSTFPNLPSSELEKFKILLPPLSEQKRIAAILNERLAAIEEARQVTQEQLKAAQMLPAAYLREVFESPEAQIWERKKLGDISEVVAGITLGPNRPTEKTSLVPYLRVANVKDGYLDLSDVYNIEATETEVEKCCLQFGDILLTEGGDPDKLGRGTFWRGEIDNCIHQNHIYRVRFNLDEVSPEFVSIQLGSSYGKAYFLAHAKQTTGIATINQQVLKNFPLMMPAITEQRRIAKDIATKMVDIEYLNKSIEDRLIAIGKLKTTLLRQAFEGEL
ncbi:restriction endonuclease subunit S [Leptolyngbya sp. FACHB-16]|uniref:restriction endonuclease subunit S n=1 Tax=unclassified Leptolyngbya TaxID=2650499 RepID=UPI001684AC7B|nr:restriction endonuclease subunit S [Leptolyngbya sp. FACHB-16]MBD2156740.1 restriction endonuclease subunit S [Leptolyngbya sp. FACHB-16]